MPALFLIAQVFFCPESPRWLMSKGRYADAFESLKRLRRHPVQAARDLYCQSLFPLIAQSLIASPDIHVLLDAEAELSRGQNRYLELFTIPCNRRATLASSIVMFM